ncbi:MAG TPA: NAD(P)(+) transhydrogenase (Re/Si-specific) subunit alpha, partial [Rhodospirillales bacterium]|nr:NAD(P)(+) transhydrogenase (Re/Si-specific) subunit alpha [Rhodospirillales bacterium]
MKIGVPKERLPEELRVAISPDTIRKMIALGFDIIIESGAG